MDNEKKKQRTGLWIGLGIVGAATLAAIDAKHDFKGLNTITGGIKRFGNGVANGWDSLKSSLTSKEEPTSNPPQQERRTFTKNDNYRNNNN